jgi:hypothetical protein
VNESDKQRRIESTARRIRASVAEHTGLIELDNLANGPSEASKDASRRANRRQAAERASKEADLLSSEGTRLLESFADGSEVDPVRIAPELVPVMAQTDESLLFRLAGLLWSVPISSGYGRRMRFLVRDKQNGKLIGLIGLTSPVFNLGARDEWIGWNSSDRSKRLIHVMDAFALGAVPPYSQLICGKLVASLSASAEVAGLFSEKYKDKTGTISGQKASAELCLVTTTSALGRSSIYNRLRIPGLFEFHRLGWTSGWGHFQIADNTFSDMRLLLSLHGHEYANGTRFGEGPNWRMRVVRVALELAGLDPSALRHGIRREVFAVPLATNWREFLCGEDASPRLSCPSAARIAEACLERWIAPRSRRDRTYLDWRRADTWTALQQVVDPA